MSPQLPPLTSSGNSPIQTSSQPPLLNVSPNVISHGDGGGGGNSQSIPFPNFCWFKEPGKLGLKGGSPSKVSGSPSNQGSNYSNPPECPDTNSASSSGNSVDTKEISYLNFDSSNMDELDKIAHSVNPVLTTKLEESNIPIGKEIAENDTPENGQSFLPPAVELETNSELQAGESQNALLKRLLQNTGCASMSQLPQGGSSFSLSNCLPSRSDLNTISHLSEAATRIPQPTTILRSGSPTKPPFKSEEPVAIQVKTSASDTERDSEKQKALKSESPISSFLDCEESVPIEMSTSEPPKLFFGEGELKRIKRRHYQSKRRQSTGKDASTLPKKRSRKMSKLEEDCENGVDALTTRLKQLSPVGVVEPDLGYNQQQPGTAADGAKLNNKLHNPLLGALQGSMFFSCTSSRSDYYNVESFANDLPIKFRQEITLRGFYNQEFGQPKILIAGCKTNFEARSPSPIRESDTPDSVVSSSSTELDIHESLLYAGLDFDQTVEGLRRRSPLTYLYSTFMARPKVIGQLDFEDGELDKENKGTEGCTTRQRVSSTLVKTSANTLVTLTLTSTAAGDLHGVLRNLANILSVSPSTVVKVEYSVSNASNQNADNNTCREKIGKEASTFQKVLNGAAKFCKHCSVIILDRIVKTKLEASGSEKLRNENEKFICSQTCMQCAGIDLRNSSGKVC